MSDINFAKSPNDMRAEARTPIDQELDKIHSGLSELAGCLDRLEARLVPIIRPDIEAVDIRAKIGQEGDMASPMLWNIRELNAKISDLIFRVNMTSSHLDI